MEVMRRAAEIRDISASCGSRDVRLCLLAESARLSSRKQQLVDRKRFAGKTILVVDDDLPLRVLLNAVLMRMGATVTMAADGQDAIEQLAQRPDLLVLDLFMPTVSGFEVLEYLRVHQPTLLARTVIITGGPPRVDALLGSMAVLHKPFDLDRLIDALTECLDAPLPTLGSL